MEIRHGREKWPSNCAEIDQKERKMRRDLAAAYRLVAHFGWDDLLATHLSARVPGKDCFLINPFGLMFEEVTASSLVKIDHNGEVLQDTPFTVNKAGFVIHSAVHAARPDANCVIHLHTRDGVAVSATAAGLLPLNQTAIIAGASIARHEFEGVAVNDAERERLAFDLGDCDMMLLSNHGTLTVGASVAEAFLNMYFLEWACSVQVRTLSMGLPLQSACPDVIERTQAEFGISRSPFATRYAVDLVWPALLRKLDRVNPGYRD